MDVPSKELLTLADAQYPDFQPILVEWGKLLGRFKINACPPRTSVAKVAKTLKLECYKDLGENVIFDLYICSTVRDFLNRDELIDDPVIVDFKAGNIATISERNEFLGKPCGFKGTWEEAVRRILEMEKEMLSQIPDVPADLKQT